MNSVDKLIKRILSVESQVKALSTTPSLAHSSIEGGSIDVNDEDGNLTLIVGDQFDGTHGAVPVTGPIPPTPTRPTAQAAVESLTVRWDGLFVNEAGESDESVVVPMDFSRVEVHLSPFLDFDASFADTLFATIETPRGGDVVISPLRGTHYVRLVTRTHAGKASAASDWYQATPLLYIPDRQIYDGSITNRHLAANAIDLAKLNDELRNDMQQIPTLQQAVDVDIPQAINEASKSYVTDDRLDPDNPLTVWPFQTAVVPQGALAPGAVQQDDIADFSLVARKFNTNRHIIY